MVKELLVGKEFTSDMLEAGGALLQFLDGPRNEGPSPELHPEELLPGMVPAKVTRRDMPLARINAALWLFLTDTNVWQYIVGSPEIGTRGPSAFYARLKNLLPIFAERSGWAFPLSHISALPDTADTFRLFYGAVEIGGGGGVRFTNSTINGVLVEDAYIYRMMRKVDRTITSTGHIAKPK